MRRLGRRKERRVERLSEERTALVLRYTQDAAKTRDGEEARAAPTRPEPPPLTPRRPPPPREQPPHLQPPPSPTDYLVEVDRDRGFLWSWSLFELIELGGDDQHPPIASRSVDPIATARLPRLSERAAIRAGERRARALSETVAGPVTLSSAAGRPARSLRPLVVVSLLLLAGALIAGAIVETRSSNPHRSKKPLRPPPATTSASRSHPRTFGSRSGRELNDEGYSKMRSGNYAAALPLLEGAVKRLRGTGTLSEAYAEFNLANTQYHLRRCNGVVALLARSQQIQGNVPAIDTLRADARRTCG
jgi:hypothetical protein